MADKIVHYEKRVFGLEAESIDVIHAIGPRVMGPLCELEKTPKIYLVSRHGKYYYGGSPRSCVGD